VFSRGVPSAPIQPQIQKSKCKNPTFGIQKSENKVAWDNAEAIAAEVLALLQAAAPHVKQPWAWAGALRLVKLTAVKRGAYPAALEVRLCVVFLRL
jgi:hypothetical protein